MLILYDSRDKKMETTCKGGDIMGYHYNSTQLYLTKNILLGYSLTLLLTSFYFSSYILPLSLKRKS